MMDRRGSIFVLSAPSGTGKSSLVSQTLAEIPNVWHSVSTTTRAPRSYEKEGVHYFFTDRETFERRIAEKKFLEWAEVHGDYYGTPAEQVDEHLAAGNDVLMDLDFKGALQVKAACLDAILIFIMPPSVEELRHRLTHRRAETEEQIERRLSIAEEEMSHKDKYDHIIVNDILQEAFNKLAALIEDRRNAAGEKAP